MVAAQALDTRKYQSSDVIQAIKSEIRKKVAFLEKDRIITDDINNMKTLVDSDVLPKIAAKYISLN